MQINLNKLFYLIVYIFKTILFAKYNYKIYNKKLLTIVCAFKKYYLEYINIFVKQLIKIIIDYCNLKYFITTKQLNCC